MYKQRKYIISHTANSKNMYKKIRNYENQFFTEIISTASIQKAYSALYIYNNLSNVFSFLNLNKKFPSYCEKSTPTLKNFMTKA